MKNLTFILLCFIAVSCLASGSIQLSKNGKALYRIVHSPEELEAAQELQLHLQEISGAAFTLVKESKNITGHAIWLGNTARARKYGIDSKKIRPEEWVIKTIGKDLIIAGGRRHAVQLGVYDFLETQLNCRWYAFDTTVIPKNPDIVIKQLDIKKRPSFDSREIFDDYHDSWRLKPEIKKSMQKFRKRIGASGDYGHMKYWPRSTTRYYNSHNFYYFLNPKKYYKDHPEYFSMNRKGERVHGKIGPSMQGGNFCLTNKKVRDIVAEKMLSTIALDRKSLPEAQWPDLYDMTPQDSDGDLCLCPACAALEKKERKMGLLLDFINDIARRVYKKYPDVTIKTSSYSTYVEPPVTLRPEKNVIIQWCNLYGYNDCYRPITHKINAGQKAQFDRWVATGANLAIWAYWNMGGQFFNPARVETMVDAIAPELRYYHKNNVTMFLTEMEQNHGDNKQNFYNLQAYVGLKLLWDITLDENKLIADFMKAYYGPAEKPMTAFLNRVRKAVAAVPSRMTSSSRGRPYCTEKFMRENWNDLEEAYRLTAPGTIYRRHVENEMLSPIFVILRNFNWKIGNREEMLARYKKIRETNIADFSTKNSGARNSQKKTLNKMRSDILSFTKLDLPVPEQFKNRGEVRILGWPQLKWAKGVGYPGQFADDPDSVTGKAMKTPPVRTRRNGTNHHSLTKPGYGKRMYSTGVGIFDFNTDIGTGTDLRKRIFKDEKYHWYKVGRYKVTQGAFVWTFYWNCQCPLESVWQADDGMEVLNLNDWEIWVSLKFTGPAYVEKSKLENCIYWDQTLLVRPVKRGKK